MNGTTSGYYQKLLALRRLALEDGMRTNHVNVFVYGTLQPGEYYYSQYCAGNVVESCQAIAHGYLFDLPLGYPAMTAGDGIVKGFRLSFDDSTILDALDQLEDYSPDRPDAENEYRREQIKLFTPPGVFLGKAWAYLMTPEKISQLGGTYLPNGRWTKQRQNV